MSNTKSIFVTGYICDGCNRRVGFEGMQCPLCGTVKDGVRRLAE